MEIQPLPLVAPQSNDQPSPEYKAQHSGLPPMENDTPVGTKREQDDFDEGVNEAAKLNLKYSSSRALSMMKGASRHSENRPKVETNPIFESMVQPEPEVKPPKSPPQSVSPPPKASPPAPASPMVVSQPPETNQAPLDDSNIAQLDDSLNEDHAKDKPAVQPPVEIGNQSKFQNNFDKFQKEEAGMSIFAPADIDYSERANKAEAHLMKYDGDVRDKLEKASRGLQQIFTNIQKLNNSAKDSTARFKVFFESFLKREEQLAQMYVLKPSWTIMEERKDISTLQPPGNIRQLHSIFENMKKIRGDYAEDILKQLKALGKEYQLKIVDENFFEEGIDKKGTQEQHKDIEKTFQSISARNKQCTEEYAKIQKKIEENKAYFDKNKKFKSDCFEDYMKYMRSCRKLWMFVMDVSERLVKFWKRAKKTEELRIKAIASLLQGYVKIEEKMTQTTQNLTALKEMNDKVSPEAMAATMFRDQQLLTSPILDSLGFKKTSIEVFLEEIKALKTKLPENIEFCLWDYMNAHALVKGVNKSIRIFRSNENYLYVYETPSREEVPMEDPIYKCRVNNLVLLFDEKNNQIQLKSSSMLDFTSFTFLLRDHKDAQEVVGYVNKFTKGTTAPAK